jgi:hypothetical protein
MYWRKKNFSSQHSMPLPGTTGIVKHKLLPEKVFGEKKRKKECRRRLSTNMYCIYVLGYPSYIQMKKALIIIR